MIFSPTLSEPESKPKPSKKTLISELFAKYTNKETNHINKEDTLKLITDFESTTKSVPTNALKKLEVLCKTPTVTRLLM